MVNLNINIQKKDLWLLSAIVVFLVGVGFVIGFGDYSSGVPTIMGHSSDEIMINDTSGNFVTLQDFIDAGGGSGVSSPACTFCQSCGGDWPSYQGTFVDYDNIARYRGGNCQGAFSFNGAFNSPQLCCK